MFLALHRSLVDAPFFAAAAAEDPTALPPRALPSSPSSPSSAAATAAAAAAAAVDAAVEPAAAAAAESGAAHHSSTTSSSTAPSPSVVRIASGLAAVVATEPGTRAAEADAFPVLRAVVLFVGSISNEKELAREYSFEMATGDPEEDNLAATILDLYGKNFADESGDSSDEPAALLSMLRGSWALAVVSERGGGSPPSSCGGGTGLHVIVARSSVNGKGGEKSKEGEGDEMEEDDGSDDGSDGGDAEEAGGAPSAAAASALPPHPPPPPLFWGVSEASPECLVVSSTPQPGLSPFPAGCFFESSPSSEGESGGKSATWRLDQFSRTGFASKATREVSVAAPSPRGGGAGAGMAGIVRPLRYIYKTRSGKDLKVVD